MVEHRIIQKQLTLMHTVYITLRIDFEKKDNVDIEKATQTAIDSVVSMA